MSIKKPVENHINDFIFYIHSYYDVIPELIKKSKKFVSPLKTRVK